MKKLIEIYGGKAPEPPKKRGGLAGYLLKEDPSAPTFKDPSTLGPQPVQNQAPVAPEQPEVSRWDQLPKAIQDHVEGIEAMCSKLLRRNDGDPELKEIVHKFLLDLSKYMGEEQ